MGPARKTATNSSAGGSSSNDHNTTTAAAAAAAAATTHHPDNSSNHNAANLSASTSDPILSSSAPGRTHSHHARGLSVSHDAVAANVADSPADSQGASPDDGGAPEDQRTKKRKGGPGSRGVANLTPEQLAKKRANGTFKPFLV